MVCLIITTLLAVITLMMGGLLAAVIVFLLGVFMSLGASGIAMIIGMMASHGQ